MAGQYGHAHFLLYNVYSCSSYERRQSAPGPHVSRQVPHLLAYGRGGVEENTDAAAALPPCHAHFLVVNDHLRRERPQDLGQTGRSNHS